MSIIEEIDVFELKKKLDANSDLTIIDIRESSELAICKIQESIHIPMMDIPNKMNNLNKNEELIIGLDQYLIPKIKKLLFLIENNAKEKGSKIFSVRHFRQMGISKILNEIPKNNTTKVCIVIGTG